MRETMDELGQFLSSNAQDFIEEECAADAPPRIFYS